MSKKKKNKINNFSNKKLLSPLLFFSENFEVNKLEKKIKQRNIKSQCDIRKIKDEMEAIIHKNNTFLKNKNKDNKINIGYNNKMTNNYIHNTSINIFSSSKEWHPNNYNKLKGKKKIN